MARKNTIRIGSGGIKDTAGFAVSSGNFVRQQAYGFTRGECGPNTTAETYFTAANITGGTEIDATCRFTEGIDVDGILSKNIFAYLLSPQDVNASTFELKNPGVADNQLTLFGTNANDVHSVNGYKGNGIDNIAHPAWKLSAEFSDDNFGFTVYVSSFETGGIKADIGVFAKAPSFRLESFATATNAAFVCGGGGNVAHGGLTPHVYTFRRGNDGTRFNEFYIDGIQVGSRFDNPSSIIDPLPATNLKIGIMAASSFGAGAAGFESDRQIGFVMIHDNLTAAETLKLSNRVFTLQATIIPGGR